MLCLQKDFDHYSSENTTELQRTQYISPSDKLIVSGHDKYGSHCGQYSKYLEGVLDQFNNPRAWKWCVRILGLTVWKLEVRSNEEADVPSAYPPGEVTAHELWQQSERQVFKEHTVAATMTDGDLRWPVQEIAAMRREEKRINFHEDQEGKEDYQTQSNEFELVPGWALLKTPDKTEQIKVVARSRWSPPQTGVEESHGLGLTTRMKTALWAEQPDWNEQKLQNLIYFPIPRILFSVVWFAKLCNDFSFCYEPLPACWLFVCGITHKLLGGNN